MGLSTTTINRLVTASVTTVVIAFGTVGQAIAQTINGAGASFPAPLYQRYFAEYKKATGVTVNYNSVGSGAGIRQFIGETVDFGATDAPPSQSEKSQMKRGMLMIPTAGGAVAVIYNLPGVNNVQISRQALGKIFSGQVTNWRQVNSKLPNKPIRVVVRADGSGTTEIFTSHLSTIDASFRSKVGTSKEPNWGFTVLKGPKNDGVAALVKQTDGAIGYVQDTFARSNKLQTAFIQNKAGRFVEPSLAEANKAMSGVTFNSDFTADVNDPKDGYPIVGLTWLLVYTDYKDDAKAAQVKRLVKWILTSGQNLNQQLEFTRIPAPVAQRVSAAVDRIK
ncbi:phosphate ABC transporter, periplasmic phosphate-binding protein [Gloeothece citriformis PCC 7424]|uniref:Phosphate-binding protein n=1 Tax=Gloeothece citriformis (strain PCC 7424) TaxID=65393 RepID=B7K8L8_GLOC7|nr:phosphate ABC transporter substrate-binding protein PstS [Gloeothece citriformis]ACK71216.1 phosphate ABC transporter, periplasmic phosphate-binding protein [Gloeothece citriformis PCC 7424]